MRLSFDVSPEAIKLILVVLVVVLKLLGMI